MAQQIGWFQGKRPPRQLLRNMGRCGMAMLVFFLPWCMTGRKGRIKVLDRLGGIAQGAAEVPGTRFFLCR